MNSQILKKASKSDAFSFIVKYFWVIPVAFLLAWAIPTLKRLIDKMDAKEQENQINLGQEINNAQNNAVSPTIQKQKSETIKKKYPLVDAKKWQDLHSSAQKIAFAFGTNPEDNHKPFNGALDFFNVAAWFEDEKSAVTELKKHSGTFSILSELYYQVYTKSRNLKTDCYKYLSKSDLEAVRAAHKKYGNYSNL